MANELNIDFRQTGLTVTATLVQGTAAVGSAINLSESGTLPGFYSGDMPAVAAGIYNVRFQSTTNRTGRGVIAWNGTAEVIIPETQIRAALGLANPDLDTQLGNIPTTTQIWTHATRALTDKDNFNLASSQSFSTTGSVGSVTGAVGSVTGAVGSVTSPVTAGTVTDKEGYTLGNAQTFSTTGSVGSVTGSVGSVTGAVTVGTLNSNVITANSINTGAITNAKFAAGAIDAAAIATDAVTEIQSGLATQASVDTKASQASVDALPNAGTIADAVWDEALSGHTIAGSTGKKLADTSTLTAGDIPAGLTAQQVWTYAAGDRTLTGTQATNLAAIPNIPTNPLLTNDARLNNLDATISSRSTLTAAQIRTELTTELARLDVAVSTRLATAGYTTPPTTSQIAAAVEAALLNDADGQKLLEAIKDTVEALFDAQADVPVSTLVSLIAAQITADHGSGSYTTANVSALALEATAQAIKAKTDNLPSDPADQSELVTLINTKASQASVDAIPTTPLLAANYTAPDNAGIAAIKAKTDNLPSDPADQSELASLISAIPTTPLLAANYTAPDNAGIAAIKAKTDNLPSDPADQSELATLISAIPTTPLLAANYTAPDNTGIAAIKAKTDNLPSDPADQSELASLISAIPTTPLLATNYTAPDNAGIAAIKAKTDNLPSDPADQSELVTLINTKASQASVDAIPTTPLLAANYTAPDNAGVAAIKAKTDNLPSDPADQSELATLISAIPTNPLLATNYTAPDNASIAAIKAKTDNLPSDPADQSELVTLINTRLAAADYVAPDNTGILTAIGALPSASTIADAVWDEALSSHPTAGSTGAKLGLASTLTVGDIPAGLSAQQVWEYATRTLTTASGLTTEQNTKLNELWRKAGLDLATPVVRILNPATGNVTETVGATTITHTETNSGNTVTTARQP